MQRLHDEGELVYTRNGMPRAKRYIDSSVVLSDTWIDIDPINAAARERLGYPTQKPLALLERIIQASSNEGDIVLDPFCGCGTAIAVAERLHRHWIGIDITHLAIALMKHRLHGAFPTDLSHYEVIGVPKDLPSAEALARQDRYQFEWWAVGLVNARPAHDKRKGADEGVDGYLFFLDDNSGKAKSLVVQVKSGAVSVRDIRELETVRRREKAEIGVFVTLQPPTRPMEQEAAAMGFYEPVFFSGRFPRLQVFTIEALLQGKEAQYPRVAPTVTFKRAQRHDKSRETQTKLF